MTRSRWLLLVVLALLGFGVWLFFYLTNQAKVTINSNDGAVIYVSESLGEGFSEVGTSTVEYKTKCECRLYIRSYAGGGLSETSLVVENRQQYKVDIDVIKPKSATEYTYGPLSNLLVGSNLVMGVNPNTKLLGFSQVVAGTYPDKLFSELPKLNKVGWFDRNNFVYKGVGTGVGYVIDGNNQQWADVAFDDFSKYGDTVFLLSSRFVSKIKGLGDKPKMIIEDYFNGIPAIEATSTSVFTAKTTFVTTDDEGLEPPVDNTIIKEYDHDGNLKFEFIAYPENEVKRLVVVGNLIFALTRHELIVIDKATNTSQIYTFSFLAFDDMEYFDNQILLSGEEGVWRFNNDTGVLQLVYGVENRTKFVPGSLTNYRSDLYFSTQANTQTKADPSLRSIIYKLAK